MRDRVPFGGAFEHVVDREVERLRADAGIHAAAFGPDAFDDAAGGLARDLVTVAAPTLLEEFRNFPGRSWLDRSATGAHDAFVASMREGGWDDLCARQPLLPDLVARLVERWRERYLDALARVHADREVLRRELAIDSPLAGAAQLAETTLRISGGSGRAVYKNRRVTLDLAWARLLAWFNECGPRHELLVPRVIDCGTHGYADVVDPTPTPDELLDARWHRTGALLCLTHLLGGGDAHEGNVMNVGEHVVLIDAEKVMRPGIVGADVDDASVVMTAWLPTEPTYLRCGLVAEVFRPRPQRWFNVGTDAIRRRPAGALLATVKPRVDELFVTQADRMLPALIAGFREAYGLILAHGLPLELFEHCRPRLIVRNSQGYLDVVDAMVMPEVLADPRRATALIDALVAQTPDAVRDLPALWGPVADFERAALEVLAVPRFSVWAVGDELVGDQVSLGRAFVESPMDRAHRFVRSMSAAQCEAQCDMIRWSIEGARRGDFRGGQRRGYVLAARGVAGV